MTHMQRLLVATLIVSVLSGCSLMREGFSSRAGGAVPASEPVPAVFDGQPRVVHEFDIGDDAQTVFGNVQIIEARDSDTFSDIARSYGLGYDELVNANPGVDPWLPGAGTRIVLPTQFVLPEAERRGIVLNIAAKRLYYFVPATDSEPGRVLTYPIGIGRVGWATPTGSAEIIAKAVDPAWYVPASVRKEHREAGDPLPAVVPPGPNNPLGRHVLKLDMPGYLLHGTNQPYGVGMRVSHGCVRLYPEDIEALYAMAGLGTHVTIVNQPIVAGWRDREFYLAAYPRLEDDARDEQTLLAESLAAIQDRHFMLRGESDGQVLAELLASGSGVATAVTDAGLTTKPLYVRNVAAPPQDAPSREEIAELLDEMMRETDAATAAGAQ
ncbi:MAG: L,D-transpeptidase family protein [Pseudomonadota bacterium]